METKHDVPAIKIIRGFSGEWTGLVITQTKITLDEARRYQSRLDDLLSRTMEGISKVKGYVDDVNDSITSLSIQVKKSMVDNVQMMSDLVQKLVPSPESHTGHGGNQERAETRNTGKTPNIPSGVVGVIAKFLTRNRGSNATDNTTDLETKRNNNKDIAKQLEEAAKLAEKQQKLASLVENVKSACEKIKSQEGINDNDIKALKCDLDAYGKTLETEKEQRQRIKQQKEEEIRRKKEKADEEARQRQIQKEEEARKKERQENEIRRRNPENWHPLVLKDAPKGDRYTNTDILCVVYAMEGSFGSLQCNNMEGQIKMADWLDIPHEEQASCPIRINSVGYETVNLELPMEVYVPYSISGKRHQPEIKVSIDNGPWKTPDLLNKREVTAFPKGINYVGIAITSFEYLQMVVAAVPKRKKFLVDKKGLNITEDCMNIQVPAGYGNDNIKITVSDGNKAQLNHHKFLKAQVRVDLDCGNKTTKDISVKISEIKLSSQGQDRKKAYVALCKIFTSGKDLLNFRMDPFLERLQKEGVVNAKEANDNKNQLDVNKRTKHLLEKKKVRMALLQIFRKWRPVMVFRADDGEWKVLDPKIAKTLHRELGCTLPEGNRRFEMMSLTVSDDSSEKDIEDIADQFVNHEVGTTVTLVCRHKADDYQAETFIHVLPAKQASKEIIRLQQHGYTRGPMELADVNIMDGETVEIYMSGNIGLEYHDRRLTEGTIVEMPYKAHKDICKFNCYIYVVDKKSLEQMDDDQFRGLLHYRVRAREPLRERTGAVEVTWMKVSKRYLSHLSMNGDLQALGKFISSKMADRNEMHDVFVVMDTTATVKEIEQRVERQCKNDSDVIRNETTLFIWANQNKDETDKKIEKMLQAVRTYPWCDEARRFVALYTKAGLFSEMSLLSMSKLLGPEWKELAIALKIPEAQINYIESLHLSEQDGKGKMLDKFRLSHHAIGLGDRLPEVFLQSLQQCGCSEELVAYVESKIK
ncbi:uncharacterized protein [Argopecten irradians]|uniref:uncharacterized protein n=1 Tax=Argopecten irradians TaxID=31199 RepID=UPI00371B75BF